MKKNNSLLGLILVALAQIMVAINIVTTKSLLPSTPALFLLTVRFTLATLILLFLHCWSPKNKYPLLHYFSQLKRKDWLYILAQALTAGVLFNLFMLLGLQYTDANNAGIITSILPLMIAIMSWLILGEKISYRTVISILLVTLGLFIISYGAFKGNTSSSLQGYLLILLSLLPEALYYILSKLYSIPLPIFLLSALLNGINALILGLLIPFYSFSPINWQYNELGSLLVLGLSSGLFYVFWYYGCEHIEGMMASLSTAIMPVTTVLFAWLFLGEHFTLIQALGMGIIISSILSYLKA